MVYDQQLKIEKSSFKMPNEVECPEPVACSTGLKATLTGIELVEGQYYVYLLVCNDQSFYCGSTIGLQNRLREHNAGEAALWTRMRRPVKLVYYETHESLLSARRREKQIKGWTIKKKLNLINGVWSKLN